MNKKNVLEKMKANFQVEDIQTIYQHGISVLNEVKKIIYELKYKKESNLPDFLYQYSDILLEKLVDYKTLYLYCVYHDCGKPFCKPDS